jgi:hypothetical protein
MALAILEWIDVDESTARFRIDTGTNTHYQLKVGRDVREDGGNEWVDDVYYTVPLRRNDVGGDPFGSATEINVPLRNLERGKSFVQLITSKAGGKAQALSDVLAIPGYSVAGSERAGGFSVSFSGTPVISAGTPHKPARRIPNRPAPLARQASLESLLGEIVKIASPVVLDLLKNVTGGSTGAGTGGGGAPVGGSSVTPTAGAPTDILGQVLKSLLAALSGPASGVPVSHPSSLAIAMSDGNRFVPGSDARYARPFIFGVDDALIASLAGPILEVLPKLMNAANQKRIELKKADNQLMGGILSDINKRLLMDKLLEAQKAAQAQGPAAPVNPEQLKALADLLAALPAAPQATSAPASIASAPLSLPVDADEPPHALSNRAMLTFAFGPAVEWNGAAKTVFDRNRTLLLKPRFTVASPVPKAPLPKAILKVVLQDGHNPAVRVEKIFKLKNVLANDLMECAFEPGELAHLPPNTCFDVLAELRWRNARSGRETRALGSAELVLVNKYFIKARGPEVSAERELANMARYRPFWNKVWEAPVLDGARGGTGDRRKYSWELNVNAKYSTLLSASHDSNGTMETKILQEVDDPESITLGVRGRMKAGIELSVVELNKLIPLWGASPVLEAAKLEALSARPFLDSAARELRYSFKLKGRAGEAGMIWVVPVFKLFGVTVSAVTAADDTGQVNATSEEDLQFPLPVAARLIGLKSAA